MKGVIWLAMLIGFSLPSALAQTSEAWPKLRIGVRSEARPFSYQSETLRDVLTAATPGPLAAENFTGYIVKICDAVLNEMVIRPGADVQFKHDWIDVVDLDDRIAKQETPVNSRFEFLTGTANGSVEPVIDILCDPATITNERRKGLIISPPVYLTGISYITPRGVGRGRGQQQSTDGCPVRNPSNPNRLLFLYGLVGNTTAASSGINALLDLGEMPQDRTALIRFLKGENPCAQEQSVVKVADEMGLEQNIDWSGPVRLFKNHKDAADAFCRGEIHYYVGDREIIIENVNAIAGCEFENGNSTFTTDRYAIYGRLDYKDNPNRALLVARFFEILSQKILSHPSIIDQAFYDTFHPTEPTRALEFFFQSVRGTP